MKPEKEFMDETRVALQDAYDCRMFRNNNGVAEFFDKKGKKMVVRYGLGVGTSDLIGWTPVTITKDMVGKQVAVFTALEGKRGRGRLTKAQEAFIDLVHRVGGFTGVFRTPEHAVDQIYTSRQGIGLEPL